MLYETNTRKEKGLIKRMKAAGFPYDKLNDDFDFNRKGFTSITQSHMKQLLQLNWLEKAYNIMFLGPPGLGKTRHSLELGIAAVKAGYNVAFTSLDQLITLFKTVEIRTNSSRRFKQIKSNDLIILDGVGLFPSQGRR